MIINITEPERSVELKDGWNWAVSVDFDNLSLDPFKPYGNAKSKSEAWTMIGQAVKIAVREGEKA